MLRIVILLVVADIVVGGTAIALGADRSGLVVAGFNVLLTLAGIVASSFFRFR